MYPHGSNHQHSQYHTPSLCVISRRSVSQIINLNFVIHLFFSRYQVQPATPYHSLGKPSTISTGQLHSLLRLHLPPIKLVVSQRSYLVLPMGNLVLRGASHLDAFSGYPVRRSLLSYATGVTTDTRALRPPRSSRTRGSSSQIPYAHSG